MRLLDERFVALGLLAALAGCGGGQANGGPRAEAAPPTLGPAGDYPMVLGEPFLVDGRLYTPADTLNHDEVGYAALDAEGADAITAAHRTLPLPSYIEVTSLETGRTILVRAERRGPMTGSHLIALSPGAAAQLGATQDAPVRVRRVNPPEQERVFLRRGERAAERMETPMTLVAVLKRKLPQQASIAAATLIQAETPEAVLALPAVAQARPITPAIAEPTSSPARQLASAASLFVQAGAFSVKANAQKVASSISGTVAPVGRFFAVRTGPFADRALAEAALAKVKHAGYSDARILSVE